VILTHSLQFYGSGVEGELHDPRDELSFPVRLPSRPCIATEVTAPALGAPRARRARCGRCACVWAGHLWGRMYPGLPHEKERHANTPAGDALAALGELSSPLSSSCSFGSLSTRSDSGKRRANNNQRCTCDLTWTDKTISVRIEILRGSLNRYRDPVQFSHGKPWQGNQH
jgi:hypothetical protein